VDYHKFGAKKTTVLELVVKT